MEGLRTIGPTAEASSNSFLGVLCAGLEPQPHGSTEFEQYLGNPRVKHIIDRLYSLLE